MVIIDIFHARINCMQFLAAKSVQFETQNDAKKFGSHNLTKYRFSAENC